MNVNKHSFTKYIDFFDFFNFCTKEKSFTLDSQRRNISRMNPHLFWLKFARSSSRNGLSDFLLTVLRLQLEISKQLKPEKKWNSCNLFSPLDNILRVIKVESWKRRKIEPDGEKGYQSF